MSYPNYQTSLLATAIVDTVSYNLFIVILLLYPNCRTNIEDRQIDFVMAFYKTIS